MSAFPIPPANHYTFTYRGCERDLDGHTVDAFLWPIWCGACYSCTVQWLIERTQSGVLVGRVKVRNGIGLHTRLLTDAEIRHIYRSAGLTSPI